MFVGIDFTLKFLRAVETIEVYTCKSIIIYFYRWDTRIPLDPITKINAHTGEVYSIDFNYFNEYLFITGSDDKTI